MGEKLLPCPFCGSDRIEAYTGDDAAHAFVICEGCGASCGEVWNARALDPLAERMAEALRQETETHGGIVDVPGCDGLCHCPLCAALAAWEGRKR